mmetsp:Transcript_20688/g.44412  ORF Transcript_20688/g.44412 Transcript_20688/m.44412 type:complete len:213 (-) Transcript_20688:909-1547(-)
MDRARGVAWVAEDEELGRLGDGRLERLGHEAVVVLGRGADHHRLGAAKLRDCEVRGPVWRGDDHLVGRIAHGEHRLEDALLAAVGAEHLSWVVGDALALGEVGADGLAKVVGAWHGSVLGHPLLESFVRRRHHLWRRLEVGLAHCEREHGHALPLELDRDVGDGNGLGGGHASHEVTHPYGAGCRGRGGWREVEELGAQLVEGGGELLQLLR